MVFITNEEGVTGEKLTLYKNPKNGNEWFVWVPSDPGCEAMYMVSIHASSPPGGKVPEVYEKVNIILLRLDAKAVIGSDASDIMTHSDRFSTNDYTTPFEQRMEQAEKERKRLAIDTFRDCCCRTTVNWIASHPIIINMHGKDYWQKNIYPHSDAIQNLISEGIRLD